VRTGKAKHGLARVIVRPDDAVIAGGLGEVFVDRAKHGFVVRQRRSRHGEASVKFFARRRRVADQFGLSQRRGAYQGIGIIHRAFRRRRRIFSRQHEQQKQRGTAGEFQHGYGINVHGLNPFWQSPRAG
jgi:hypothetical protein